MQNKKILAIMLVMGMTLTPFAAYAGDDAAVPADDQTVSAAESVDVEWNLDDFVITDTTLEGLSASGQEKIKKSSDLKLPEQNANGEYITAIGDGTMGVGTFGYKDTSDNSVYVPTSVVFPSKLESIGKFAFSAKLDNATKEQVGLTSVEFPDTLKTIGMTAFQNAPLTEIKIPDSVTTIGTGAFTNGGNIKATKLTLSSSLTNIETSAFNSQAIEDIVIPEGVTNISQMAFAGNFSKTVSLPSTLKSIGSKAFWNHQFTEVKIPDSVDTIGTSAFSVVNADAQKTLTKVNIPDNLTKIDKQVFEGSSLESVEIPASLTAIDTNAFKNSADTVLVKVGAPEQLTNLADGSSHKIVCDINSGFVTVTDNLPEVTYNGTAFEPVISVSNNGTDLEKNTDYTLEYSDNINAGTASVTVKGAGKYCGELTRNFTIAPKEVTAAIEISEKSYVYNGKVQTPDVKVTADGQELTAESYDVTYEGSTTNAGTYKVIATLKGNYAGEAVSDSVTISRAKSAIYAKAYTKNVKKATVKKKAVTISPIKVSKAKGKIAYKKLSGSSKLKVNSKTGKVTVVKHKCSKKIKSYKIRVKVSCGGTSNYKGSSKTITVTVKMK